MAKKKNVEWFYLHPEESRMRMCGFFHFFEIEDEEFGSDNDLDGFRKLILMDVRRFKRIWKYLLKDESMTIIEKVEMIRNINYENDHAGENHSPNKIRAMKMIKKIEWLRGIPQLIRFIQKRFIEELSSEEINKEHLLKNLNMIFYFWYSSYRSIHYLFDELLFLHDKHARRGARSYNATVKMMNNCPNAIVKKEADEKKRACVQLWKKAKSENPNLKIKEFASRYKRQHKYSVSVVINNLNKWVATI
jgi:hypothetical protein